MRVNAWRPYEESYVKAMALSGVSRDECEARLWAVNKRLRVSYKSHHTIARMAKGAFLEYANKQRKIRNEQVAYHATKYHSVAGAAQKYGCNITSARRAVRNEFGASQVHTNYWADWECAYILQLNMMGLSYREVCERLAPISRKLGRSIRTKHAIANKTREIKKNG